MATRFQKRSEYESINLNFHDGSYDNLSDEERIELKRQMAVGTSKATRQRYTRLIKGGMGSSAATQLENQYGAEKGKLVIDTRNANEDQLDKIIKTNVKFLGKTEGGSLKQARQELRDINHQLGLGLDLYDIKTDKGGNYHITLLEELKKAKKEGRIPQSTILDEAGYNRFAEMHQALTYDQMVKYWDIWKEVSKDRHITGSPKAQERFTEWFMKGGMNKSKATGVKTLKKFFNPAYGVKTK